MLRIIKNKSGMTLLEVVVSMMLFAIAATAVSVVLVPVLRVYASANELAECNTLLDNVANQMIRDLANATAPLEDDNTLPAENTISVTIDTEDVKYVIDSNGALCYVDSGGDEIPVLSKNYYKNKSVAFSFDSAGTASENAYTLTVSILNGDDEIMITRKYAVRPLALIQYE